MSFLIVIPARFASSRYPGKPLVSLVGATDQGKSLIQRSWEAARSVADVSRVVVATDDTRICAACEQFGAEVVMTSKEAANGTARVAEAYQILGQQHDIVVNLQGDAPLTPPWFVTELVHSLRERPDAQVATPVLRTDGRALSGFRHDLEMGRVGGTTVVFDHKRNGIYFSKQVIPHTFETYGDDEPTPVWHHVGCYAYRPDALAAYANREAGPLETLEGLEQLRFLEHGIPILCVEVESKGQAFWELNNPQDKPKIEAMLRKMGIE